VRIAVPKHGVVYLVSAVVALFLGCVAFTWAESLQAPGAELDTNNVTLPAVFRGEALSHVFVLRNRGNAELKIEKVSTVCGGEATVSPLNVPPGGESKVLVRFWTNELPTGEGMFRPVRLKTNDPRRPEIDIGVTLSVRDEFGLSETMIDFDGNLQSRAEHLVLITRTPGGSSEILSVSSTDDSVSVRRIDQSSGIILRVNEISPLKSRIHFGNIIIRTTSLFRPEIRIPVRGQASKADEQ
jgi:hypothetical protein